ncbi:MAG: hypothetical protein M3422_19015, partial [Actinomycetota bacterium]|nr:hypothetical protein [Actinomycetota bacterium]
LIWVTWSVFVVDYVVRLCLARQRSRFVLRNPFDLAVVCCCRTGRAGRDDHGLPERVVVDADDHHDRRYGDRYPVTGEGRLVAATLMVGGIALLGVVTRLVASGWCGRRPALRKWPSPDRGRGRRTARRTGRAPERREQRQVQVRTHGPARRAHAPRPRRLEESPAPHVYSPSRPWWEITLVKTEPGKRYLLIVWSGAAATGDYSFRIATTR